MENRAQSPKGDAAHGTYLSKYCWRNSVNKFIKHSPALGCSIKAMAGKLDQPCVNYRERMTKLKVSKRKGLQAHTCLLKITSSCHSLS